MDRPAQVSRPWRIDRTSATLADVAPLATSEIGKIDAGLSCMSLRWTVR
jgi:N-dimethylarginine dimethylaminohydrolase